MILLLLAGIEGESNVIATSVATCAEQVTLLVMFATYCHSQRTQGYG